MAKSGQFEARFTMNLNPKFSKQVNAGVKEGIDRGMQAIVRTAARMSPYDTGHNARSISYSTSWGTGVGPLRNDRSELFGIKKGQHAAVVMTGSGYGGWLETGTSRMRARPYLRPAVEQEAAYLLQSIRDAIKRRT